MIEWRANPMTSRNRKEAKNFEEMNCSSVSMGF